MPDAASSGSPSPSWGIRIARFVEILAAALLTGGLVATAAIAQVAFGSPDVLSRETGGRLMAEVFERSIPLEVVLVGLIAIAAALAGARGRASAMALLGIAFLGAHLYLGGEMRKIRVAHGGTTANLAADHPDRLRFGALHGVYALASLGLLVLGTGVLGAHALRRAP